MLLRNLDLDTLRILVTTHDAGGFAQAADRVGRTPSAISLQMKRLQEELGTPLFRRHGRVLKLTEAGQTALGYARRMLALNDDLLQTMQELPSPVRSASVLRRTSHRFCRKLYGSSRRFIRARKSSCVSKAAVRLWKRSTKVSWIRHSPLVLPIARAPRCLANSPCCGSPAELSGRRILHCRLLSLARNAFSAGQRLNSSKGQAFLIGSWRPAQAWMGYGQHFKEALASLRVRRSNSRHH